MHHYFGVNLDTVWKVIKKDIHDLKGRIEKIKEDISNSNKNNLKNKV